MVTSGFLNYPVLELEEQFEASTMDHVQRQKETGKFLKKLGKNTPDFDKLWKKSLNLLQSLYNLKYVETTALTSRSLESLAEIYANFDLELQEFNKMLKKLEKSNPDVFSYYQEFSDAQSMSVFELYAEDMKEHYAHAKSRHEKYGVEGAFGVEYEDMLGYYKVALKKVKEEKKKNG
jgi:hypothetical protein